jgi:nucleotide-binding universal stress UspA family protein
MAKGSKTMALKDILVHVESNKQGRARLAAAVQLAARHDAHLIGLYVLHLPDLPGYVRLQMSDEVLRSARDAAMADAAAAEAAFNDAVQRAGVKAEWRNVEGNPLKVLALHARYADIAVVGQRDETSEGASIDPDLPDQLVLSAGRPMLVIPYVGEYPVIGERVMVAWDSSRLATRAVNDALPFLVRAKHVFVIAINPSGDGEEGHGEIPSADICLHLARHGVNAEAQHVFADDLGVGEMLLSRSADEGCDLMVIGAWGHARWRELVLGGVTRHMLGHMTLPVLMSH